MNASAADPGPPPPRVTASVSAEQIAEIFARVLGREVTVTSDIFAAGASSLHLVRASAALARRLGLAVNPVDLFDYPTPQALAAMLAGSAEPGDIGPESAGTPPS